MPRLASPAISIAVLSLAPAALAQSYGFVVQSPSSSVQIDASLVLDMPGELIGDWDATTNPTGTRTLPGLFGGSGNQPVSMSLAPTFDTHVLGEPTGGFDASFDPGALAFELANLDVAVANGPLGSTHLTLELLYSTFRTFQPDSLYLGGIPVPIPLGQASVSNVRLIQIGASIGGALVQLPGCPACYDASVLVPVELSFDVDVLGQVGSIGPFPTALPLAGTLSIGTNGTAHFTLTADASGNQTIPDPLPGVGLTDFPLDLPTILPPGSTAHLLIDATVAELAFQFASHAAIEADGGVSCAAESYCIGAPNSVGAGARIDARGSPSIAANVLGLAVVDVPPGRTGVFCYGPAKTQTPFGEGYLCIGQPTFRTAPVRADAQGVAVLLLDNTAFAFGPIAPATQLNFQLWYRDPSGGPAGFNLSDAIEVTFCP